MKRKIGCSAKVFEGLRFMLCRNTTKRDAADREIDKMAAELMLYFAALRELEPAMRRIADGHDDAKGLAQSVIVTIDAARSAVEEKT